MEVVQRVRIVPFEDGTFWVADPLARRGSDRMGCHVPDQAALLSWCILTAEINARRA
jgi:hypothetical protein